MLNLNIPNNGKFCLEFDDEDVKRFSLCKFLYKSRRDELNLCEDYLYVFIEDMLGRIKKIPTLEQPETFGKLGKWQEYFYYDASVIELHHTEIEQMKKAIFVSTECYGTFLYEFKGKIWLEIDKGYSEQYDMPPDSYYDSPNNYQIMIAQIPEITLYEWMEKLEELKEKLI